MALNAEEQNNIREYIKIIIGPFLSLPKDETLISELQKIREAFTIEVSESHPYYILRAASQSPEKVILRLDTTFHQLNITVEDVKLQVHELIKAKIHKLANNYKIDLIKLGIHVDTWRFISSEDSIKKFSTKPIEQAHFWETLGHENSIHQGRLYLKENNHIYLDYTFTFPDGEFVQRTNICVGVYSDYDSLLDTAPVARRHIQHEALVYALDKLRRRCKVTIEMVKLILTNSYLASRIITHKFYYQLIEDELFPLSIFPNTPPYKGITQDEVNFLLQQNTIALLEAKICNMYNIFELDKPHLHIAGIYLSFLKAKLLSLNTLLDLTNNQCEIFSLPLLVNLRKKNLISFNEMKYFSLQFKPLFINSFYSEYLLRLSENKKNKGQSINWWHLSKLTWEQIEFLLNPFIISLISEQVISIFNIRDYAPHVRNALLDKAIQSLILPEQIITPYAINNTTKRTLDLISTVPWLHEAINYKIITMQEMDNIFVVRDLFAVTFARRLFAIFLGSPYTIKSTRDSPTLIRDKVYELNSSPGPLIDLIFNQLFEYICQQINSLPKSDISSDELASFNYIFSNSLADNPKVPWSQVYENIVTLTEVEINAQTIKRRTELANINYYQKTTWMTLYKNIENSTILQQFLQNILLLGDFFSPTQKNSMVMARRIT